MIKDKLKKIKGSFIDEEGKPKLLPAGILIITVVVVLFLVVNLFSSEKIKKAAGSFNIDYDLPKPPKESKVKIDPGSKETYLKKEELSAVLDQELSGAFNEEADEIMKRLDTNQRKMMIQIRKERKEDIKGLKQELEAEINNKLSSSSSSSNFNGDVTNKTNEQEITGDPKAKNSNKQHSNSNSDTNNSRANKNNNSTNNEQRYTQNRNLDIPDNSYKNYSQNGSTSYRDYNQSQDNSENGYQQQNSLPQESPSSMMILDNFEGQVNNSLVVNNAFKEEGPDYRVMRGIKSGTMIPAKLKVGLVSSEAKAPALVKVTQDIKYEGEVYIPKGSLFLGYATADYGVRQMFVTLEKLIIGDREIDVKAHLVKKDGTPGFCSEYIDLTMEKFFPSFLMNFTASILQSFKDVTYIVTDNGMPQKYYRDTLRNKAIDGSTQGITQWTDRLMSDAQKHEAIIIVDTGVEAKVFIDKKIPASNFKKE